MDDEPMWAADHVVALTLSSAITILETANEFAIKGNHVTLVKGNRFDGTTKTDPHKRIHEFLKICDMFKYRDTENKVVRLMMFPLSLTGEAKIWLDELNERTIETWDELRTTFISRFFPPALFDRLLEEIQAFSQYENESLTDAWLHMKEMLQNCHGHNLSKGNIIKIFYHGLSEINQEVLNAAGGGIFLYKTPNQAYQLLEDKVLLKLDWVKNQKTKSSLTKTIAFTDEDSSNSDTNKIMARMDAVTLKMDAHDTQPNPKGHNSKAYQPSQARIEHVNSVFTRSSKSYNPPDNLNDQQKETPINFDSDDEDDEPTPQPKSKDPKPAKDTSLPKPYKPKIPYPQRLRKEKMEAQYGKFLDMIRAVRINVPLVDVLAGMPNYGKFLKELISNKHKIKQISAAFLSDESSAVIQNKVPLKIRDPRSFLIPFGKSTFPAVSVILKMEKDSKVPLILGRSILHTADAVVRVKQKQLNLGVGTERMIFNIDFAMKHSYSTDNTCFSIDVIDEILEKDFDALLDKEPSFLPVIISSSLSKEKKNKLISVLKKHKQAFAWKTIDIPGICPSFSKHKIQLLDNKKPIVQKQRRPNPNMQEKGGITVVTNENDELVPTRTIIEKKTFTYPFGTYAYRRMPFDLCNAPATFQRCMLAIFYDMIKESVEVFMDDFSVFENTFKTCLNNLDKMLQRCKDAHLVLNWEKCHFMVKEGIVLGHKVSSVGLEVDNAKINVISKLPPSTNIKDFANYLVSDVIPKGMTYQQKNKFFSELKRSFWEEPFKVCSDGMIRHCISRLETQTILDQCHHGPTDGHYGPNVTAKKVLDSEFYWTTIIKEPHTLVHLCEGIDFMRPLSKSYKFEYILVVIVYVSKWAEAQALPTNDARVVVTFLKRLFCRFRMPKALISDRERVEVYYECKEPFKSLKCLWVRSKSIAATLLEKVVTSLIEPAIKQADRDTYSDSAVDSDVQSCFFEDKLTSFCQEIVLRQRVIGSPLLNVKCAKLRDVPEAVLVRSGLSTVWLNRKCEPLFRKNDNTIMGIYDFMTIPSWSESKVVEEPHGLAESILELFDCLRQKMFYLGKSS
nr:reverse transcriptase domain-containing protein [Tanacetum cinerariifolium]